MSQELLREDLRKEIAAGRVLAIIGAGVSIGATRNAPVASWTGLLRDGVERCAAVIPSLPANWKDRSVADLESGDLDDLLATAGKIAAKLGAPAGPEYRLWLRETVGALRAEDRAVLEALRDLGVPIATTNYDGLIEEACSARPTACPLYPGPRLSRARGR
jgi:hypothetical protein